VAAASARLPVRMEITFGGRVSHSAHNAEQRLVLSGPFVFAPPADGWTAAPHFQKPDRTIRFGHSSPVYVDLAAPTMAAEDAKFFLEWMDREMRFYQESTAFRREADRAAMLDFFARGRAVYESMIREQRCKWPNRFGMMVSAAGFEPATHALKGHCSTN